MPRDISYNYYDGPPDEPECRECDAPLVWIDGLWACPACERGAEEINEDDPREDR